MKKYDHNSIEQHPFETFVKGKPKFLIIGSFPTTKNRITFDFYYPSATNKFWKIMSQVFPNSKAKYTLRVSVKDSEAIKAKNKKDREDFCKENKIAITDMIATCVRMNNNSKDSQLLVHKYTDIIEILENNNSIKRVIITAKSLGSSANHHFYQYLTMNGIDFLFDEQSEIPKGVIRIGKRKIDILSIDSTSYLNSHSTENDLVKLYKFALKNV